ncbi:MAG: efflux RND transporter permease subunit, partial [Oceanococcaceae bacterium]
FETVYSDLLPQDDPFVQVYQQHPHFGSPLTLVIMVRNRQGDIYNAQTLGLVSELTRAIDLAPGVDHTQVVSISTERARYSHATASGIDMRPLMGDTPPRTESEIDDFRQRVEQAPVVKQFLITADDSATLIAATFIEHQVDWGKAFEYAQGLVEAARDSQHEVLLNGQPALYGWIYRFQDQLWIWMGLSVLILLALLWWQTQHVLAILPTLLCASTAALWAFGLVGWLQVSIDPLLMVVPLLLLARSFSHSVQFSARFREYRQQGLPRREAAKTTLEVMLTPSVLSITTDVLGIVIVAAVPIPAMVNHALFCGMWALWLMPTGTVLMTALLAALPDAPVRPTAANGSHALLQPLSWPLSSQRRQPALLAALALAVVCTWTANQIEIGNPVEGSYLLAEDSEFNHAARLINDHFAGINTLEIILEAKDPATEDWVAVQPQTVRTALALQKAMESSDFPPKASLTFANYLSEVNRLYNGGDVRWLPLDLRERSLSASAVAAMMGSSSEAFNHVVDPELRHATVSFWYEDNTQRTVDQALKTAHEAVTAVGMDQEQFVVRLASGPIALQEAMNTVVTDYHLWIVACLNLAILLIFSLSYGSILAGLILLAPVNLAHQAMIAVMHVLGIGLDVNSMIVAAIGLGVGIDYGIYLLSRVREELHSRAGLEDAVQGALGTSGRAIVFTAGAMALAILPIYGFAQLQFVADMALLIICIMSANVLSALVLLPLLILLLRPAFLHSSPARVANPEQPSPTLNN